MSTTGSGTSRTGAATDTDVVVVGYGPVGATVAGLLARRGRRVIVVERDLDLFPLPRAAHLDHEVLRILQELGCADEVVREMRRNIGMDFLTADHRTLLAMRTPTGQPYGWPSSVFFNQPHLERTMRSTVEAAGVDVRLGRSVIGVTDRPDPPAGVEGSEGSVTVTLDDGSTLTAPFVVACDGARSTVRRLLGIELDDLRFEEPWLVVDLVLERPVSSLPTHALQVCDPARPHTLVPMPDPRFRFEFMLLPGEDPAEIQRPDVVEQLTARWLAPGDARLERSAVYTFHGLIARRWRDGRILLAGDAAHQMPPFLGQGMCSGMRDALNLVWKLDAVLDGAPIELLDTYQAEREPHVRTIVQSAVDFGRIICTTDAAVAADRDAAMLANAPTGEPTPPPDDGPGLTPDLAPGVLVTDSGGAMSAQPTIDGQRLDDLVGPRWSVLLRGTANAMTALDEWRARDAVVLDADTMPGIAAVLDRAGADVVVVRPDRIVFAAGPDVPAIPALVR